MIRRALLLAAPFLAIAPQARPATWSERPAAVIIPSGPGSASDFMPCVAAVGHSTASGQPVVVVQNSPGVSSTLGAERVVRAAIDGHTLVLSADDALVGRGSMDQSPLYVPVLALAPTSVPARTRSLLVVNDAVPTANLAQVITLTRAWPSKPSHAHTGQGFSVHLGMELSNQRASRFDIIEVPYANPEPLIADLTSGLVKMTITNSPARVERTLAGDFRAISVISGDRIPGLPDVPTVAEAGFPGFEPAPWFGMLDPARTPPQVLTRGGNDLRAADAETEIRARFESGGLVPVGTTAAEFRALMPVEIARTANSQRHSDLLRGR